MGKKNRCSVAQFYYDVGFCKGYIMECAGLLASGTGSITQSSKVKKIHTELIGFVKADFSKLKPHQKVFLNMIKEDGLKIADLAKIGEVSEEELKQKIDIALENYEEPTVKDKHSFLEVFNEIRKER